MSGVVSLHNAIKQSTCYGKMEVREDVHGVAAAVTVSAGQVNTWLPLIDAALTGGYLDDKSLDELVTINNLFYIDSATGKMTFDFDSDETRSIRFNGATSMRSSANNVDALLGLFKYVDGGSNDVLLLETRFSFTSLDRYLTISDQDVFLIDGQTEYIAKFKTDTVATYTVDRFNVSFKE